jgi:large subunit ribosomal protein L21
MTSPPPPPRPLVLSRSLQTLLPKLQAQKPHYIITHIHKFPYLLTEGDTLRLPFHMKNVAPGDILRFNRASILGSRDFTLKAGTSNTESYDKKRTGEPNYLDERLFECRVRIMGIETQPEQIKEKKKRRNRHKKIVRSQHKYTLCRIMDVRVKTLEELMKGEQGMVLLEGEREGEATLHEGAASDVSTEDVVGEKL